MSKANRIQAKAELIEDVSYRHTTLDLSQLIAKYLTLNENIQGKQTVALEVTAKVSALRTEVIRLGDLLLSTKDSLKVQDEDSKKLKVELDEAEAGLQHLAVDIMAMAAEVAKHDGIPDAESVTDDEELIGLMSGIDIDFTTSPVMPKRSTLQEIIAKYGPAKAFSVTPVPGSEVETFNIEESDVPLPSSGGSTDGVLPPDVPDWLSEAFDDGSLPDEEKEEKIEVKGEEVKAPVIPDDSGDGKENVFNAPPQHTGETQPVRQTPPPAPVPTPKKKGFFDGLRDGGK